MEKRLNHSEKSYGINRYKAVNVLSVGGRKITRRGAIPAITMCSVLFVYHDCISSFVSFAEYVDSIITILWKCFSNDDFFYIVKSDGGVFILKAYPVWIQHYYRSVIVSSIENTVDIGGIAVACTA